MQKYRDTLRKQDIITRYELDPLTLGLPQSLITVRRDTSILFRTHKPGANEVVCVERKPALTNLDRIIAGSIIRNNQLNV
ncbi:hypothetical protein JCM19379_26270 [Methyloparacoccus murrellii]